MTARSREMLETALECAALAEKFRPGDKERERLAREANCLVDRARALTDEARQELRRNQGPES